MTTLVRFSPSPSSNFQFQATLDTNAYNIVITWNYAGQRYYINIYDSQGARILTFPLIASPDGYYISLTAGYFTTAMIFRDSSQTFEIG